MRPGAGHGRQLQIELCFLPAYSPNLNLIERLWKFVKKQCLYSHYYADFTAFKTAIWLKPCGRTGWKQRSNRTIRVT